MRELREKRRNAQNQTNKHFHFILRRYICSLFFFLFSHSGFAGEYFEGGIQMGAPVKRQIKVLSKI